MKIAFFFIVGVLVTGVGISTLGGFSGDAGFPEKPDPNFDYHGALFEHKSAWMQKFAQRFIAAKNAVEAQADSGGVTSTYTIDTNKRRLIIRLEQPAGSKQDATEIGNESKQKITAAYTNVLMKNCDENIKKIGLIGDTNILFEAETNLINYPVVAVLLSRETCKQHLLSSR